MKRLSLLGTSGGCGAIVIAAVATVALSGLAMARLPLLWVIAESNTSIAASVDAHNSSSSGRRFIANSGAPLHIRRDSLSGFMSDADDWEEAAEVRCRGCCS